MYWLTGVLGIAMGVAPFVMGYSDNQAALWTSIVLGAVVLLASAIEGADLNKSQWEYWVVGLAGILAVIAPFVFGFGALTMAVWTVMALGAAFLILAAYEVLWVSPTT
jgi:hypothetical protein